jgi:hypothetical protein
MGKARKQRYKNTAGVLRFLRADWDHLSSVQRGESVAELVSRGYSRRELARILTLCEGTVRYYLRRVKLAQDRAKSHAGTSVQNAFSEKCQAIAHAQEMTSDTTAISEECHQKSNDQTPLNRTQQQAPSHEPPRRTAADIGNNPPYDTEHGGRIEEGHLMLDHVHMMIAIPPKYAVSQVIGYMKGKSAIHLARVLRREEAKFCGSAFLGTRVFRVHRGPGRGGRTRVHPEGGARGPSVGSDGPLVMSGHRPGGATPAGPR